MPSPSAALRPLLFVLSLSLSPLSLALEDQEYSAAYSQCMDKSDGVTTNMLDCATAELQRQDARLNHSYKAALKELNPEKQKQLRDIQRLWIQFRDQSCGLYSDLTGGTIDRMFSASCLLKQTRVRADDLEKLAEPLGN